MSLNETQKRRDKRQRRWMEAILVFAVIGLGVGGVYGTHALRRFSEIPSRMNSTNKVFVSMTIMRHYDQSEGRLPTDYHDPDGRPLLSWRVAVLPYIESDDLFQKFHLDEPWDGPNNAKLIPMMPRHFACDKFEAEERPKGLTRIKRISGPGTAFEIVNDHGCYRSRWSIEDLRKSPRNLETIFCVEAGDPVIWTKPEDIAYEPNKPLPLLKPVYERGVIAVLGNGRMLSLQSGIPESVLRANIEPMSESKETLDP